MNNKSTILIKNIRKNRHIVIHKILYVNRLVEKGHNVRFV